MAAFYRVSYRMIGLIRVSFSLLYLPCCFIIVPLKVTLLQIFFDVIRVSLSAPSGRGWNRTSDTGIFSPLLYRLSYPSLCLWYWPESNWRNVVDFQSTAIPTQLQHHYKTKKLGHFWPSLSFSSYFQFNLRQ